MKLAFISIICALCLVPFAQPLPALQGSSASLTGGNTGHFSKFNFTIMNCMLLSPFDSKLYNDFLVAARSPNSIIFPYAAGNLGFYCVYLNFSNVELLDTPSAVYTTYSSYFKTAASRLCLYQFYSANASLNAMANSVNYTVYDIVVDTPGTSRLICDEYTSKHFFTSSTVPVASEKKISAASATVLPGRLILLVLAMMLFPMHQSKMILVVVLGFALIGNTWALNCTQFKAQYPLMNTADTYILNMDSVMGQFGDALEQIYYMVENTYKVSDSVSSKQSTFTTVNTILTPFTRVPYIGPVIKAVNTVIETMKNKLFTKASTLIPSATLKSMKTSLETIRTKFSTVSDAETAFLTVWGVAMCRQRESAATILNTALSSVTGKRSNQAVVCSSSNYVSIANAWAAKYANVKTILDLTKLSTFTTAVKSLSAVNTTLNSVISALAQLDKVMSPLESISNTMDELMEKKFCINYIFDKKCVKVKNIVEGLSGVFDKIGWIQDKLSAWVLGELDKLGIGVDNLIPASVRSAIDSLADLPSTSDFVSITNQMATIEAQATAIATAGFSDWKESIDCLFQ